MNKKNTKIITKSTAADRKAAVERDNAELEASVSQIWIRAVSPSESAELSILSYDDERTPAEKAKKTYRYKRALKKYFYWLECVVVDNGWASDFYDLAENVFLFLYAFSLLGLMIYEWIKFLGNTP